MVSSGGQHTCGIRNTGSLWCWGFDGINAQQNRPTQVGVLDTWATVSAGVANTRATRLDASLWCWGINDHGQLGQGDQIESGTPIQVQADDAWLVVSAGGQHTCATHTDQTLWCFGANAWGEMGDHSLGDRFIPTPVDRISIWKVLTDGGGSHDCTITRQATLWCWGFNNHGQLGDGTTTTGTLPEQIGSALWSTAADPLSGGTLTGGGAYTCAIQGDQTLWCWGANGQGQLGTGRTQGTLVPTQVGTATTWKTVHAAVDHTCATKADGTLWCWGNNANGQLGNGTRTDAHAPVQVGTDTDWDKVSPGPTHTCALKLDKSLWCWGANSDGELGNGTTRIRKSPTRIGSSTWTTVSAGGRFTCGTQTGDTLWCWGFNGEGEVAQPPDSGPHITPTQVGSLTTWLQVDSATDHNCAVQTPLSLLCWGLNRSGDLGNADPESDFPVAIPQKIWTRAVTFDSMSSWKPDDTMACWGNDTIGQLGDGSPVPSRIGPVSVEVVPD